MKLKLTLGVAVCVALLASLMLVMTAAANPPAPGDQPYAPPPVESSRAKAVKPLDQPNPLDYWRMTERQRLLESGQTAEAAALAKTGTDRILVILVEFAGTDTVTWTQGVSKWDPLGRADPNEAVFDAGGNVVVGDCSNIITQTKTFTYTGPVHNQIPRPLSAADRSGQSIWTENFSSDWFKSFMFGNGIKFDYARVDGSKVNEDFTGKSVQEYFQDLSGGQYNINGDVIGWLPLAHSTWWYGADRCPGNRSGMSSGGGSDSGIPGAGGTKGLVKDALDAVNAISNTIPGFDWKNYDTNGDGVIDRLWIVHAGYGEEDGGDLLNRTEYGEAGVWSHSSSIPLYPVAPGISAGPYIVMPENGGIGVFAHEYAHNLGALDLYAYGNGETSTGFWALQADDWTGYPIGYEPPAADPMHLDLWGWLNPFEVSDPSKVYEVTLGQASNFPGGDGVYRGAKIKLDNGASPLPVSVWQGNNYWWGGKQDLANSRMTTKAPIAVPAGGAALSFDIAYGLETEWDFLWLQASADGGATWQTLTNTHTSCAHDPGWIGGSYGFPEDLCAAGLGGLTGYNASFPSPDTEVFDLSKFAGQSVLLRFWYMTDWGTTNEGPFVDSVQVKAGSNVLFADDAESGDGKWTYDAPWQRSTGIQPFTHNIYLQWRNVGPDGGYDRSLGDPRWRFGPANTGLLVWYNNNFYSDNEIFGYLNDFPGFGPKGRMLVVDSHPEPYRYPDLVAAGYNNEGGNLTSRGQMRDAPFSLKNSISFTNTDPYGWDGYPLTPKEVAYVGRPAVSSFHDAFGYYSGGEFVPGGPVGQTSPRWMTKQWDASATVPARDFYGVKAPGYDGTSRFRFGCTLNSAGQVLCYSFAAGLGYKGESGNPGELGAQYGWHVQILSQTEMTATVRIWNSMVEADTAFAADKSSTKTDDTVKYSFDLKKNEGVPLDLFACAPLDTSRVGYVPFSGKGGAVPLPMPCEQFAAALKQGPVALAQETRGGGPEPVAVAWTANVPAGGAGSFSFGVKVKAVSGELSQNLLLFDNGELWRTLAADPVSVAPPLAFNTPVTGTFTPVADAFLGAGYPNDKYGSWAFLYAGSNDLLRSVIRFNLGSIDPVFPVDKATLMVYADSYSGGGSPADLAAYQVTTPWDESTVTWNTPWTTPGGDFDPALVGKVSIFKSDVPGWKSIDVTPLVATWVATPGTNDGAMVRLVNITSFTTYRLDSRNHWYNQYSPKLVVNYRKP